MQRIISALYTTQNPNLGRSMSCKIYIGNRIGLIPAFSLGAVLCLLAAASLPGAEGGAESGSQGLGWPNWRGAGCDGAASETGIDYVDSLQDAKLLWTSEALVGATYVGTCTGRTGLLATGVSSPIAADGKVFLYYYMAAKEPVVLNTVQGNRDRFDEGVARNYHSDTFFKELVSKEEYVRLRANVYAQDRIVCMDADTGKTLWDVALPGFTPNTKRSSSKLEPAYADGILAAASEGGQLCGIDAETGKILWNWTDEELAKSMVSRLEHAAEKKTFINRTGLTANLMIADGVVIYPGAINADGRSKHRQLMGFDLKTGERLWDHAEAKHQSGKTIPLGHVIPLRWTHKGKEYGVAGGTCFEARTGKFVWQVNGRSTGRGGGSAALSENYIVFGSSGGKGKGMTAYRISPEGAELAWALAPELRTDTPSLCIYNGYVYAIRARSKDNMGVLAVELASGKVVVHEKIAGTAGAGHPSKGCDGCSSLFAFGGRFCYRAANKDTQGTIVVWDAAPKTIAHREFFTPASYACAATPVVAMGRLFLRGEGHVLCYDLRK